MNGHQFFVPFASLLCVLCFSPLIAEAQPDKRAATEPQGDPLPKGAIARLGQLKSKVVDNGRNVAEIFKVKHTLDGKVLAAANCDGTIGLWSLEDHRMLHELKAKAHTYSDIAFTSDGKQLVTCND